MPLGRLIEFIPGTKAEAGEVNYNFNTVKSFVDGLEVNLTDVINDIAQLEVSKANTNGDYRVRFAVADPLNNYDAVNLQTLNKKIGNTINYIYGLYITKVGDNTIMVSAGSCYDSTLKVIMVLTEEISKTNSTQGANTTYYVYLIAKEDESVDILIVQNATEPPLPSEYVYYRQIGSYTTDSSNKIFSIVNNQSRDIISGASSSVRGVLMPDYSKRVSINSGYKTPDNGFIHIMGTFDSYCSISFDGVKYSYSKDQGDGQSSASGQFLVGVGTTVTFNIHESAYYIPFKNI